MLHQKKLILALSLVPQIICIKLLSQHPKFVERYYSEGLYPYISKTFRFVLGWLPFSFGDIIYALAIIYSLWWLLKYRKRIKTDLKNWIVDIFAAVALIYFAFHLFWGFNYYRLPLHKNLNLSSKYTTSQLVSLTETLITHSNALHLKIVKHDSIPVQVPYDRASIFQHIPKAYENLTSKFPHLEYTPKSTKCSLFSTPLSYMGFSGYLNPLTNEAQVNTLIPLYKFPTTAAHEIAHQLGYAAENEANFIGFMATSSSKDAHIKYCGLTFGLRFCLNEIYYRDPCIFEDLTADINKGILKNYETSRQFWKLHENPLEPLFKKLYGNFLKANNQSKGIESYNYVVALLVNYLETHPL